MSRNESFGAPTGSWLNDAKEVSIATSARPGRDKTSGVDATGVLFCSVKGLKEAGAVFVSITETESPDRAP